MPRDERRERQTSAVSGTIGLMCGTATNPRRAEIRIGLKDAQWASKHRHAGRGIKCAFSPSCLLELRIR